MNYKLCRLWNKDKQIKYLINNHILLITLYEATNFADKKNKGKKPKIQPFFLRSYNFFCIFETITFTHNIYFYTRSTMNKTNLLENFISILFTKFSKRYELVSFIAENLCIEKESASRRLSGKVQFTVAEIGTLAQKLGISLDSLITTSRNETILPTPLMLEIPRTEDSMDNLIDSIIPYYRLHQHTCKEMTELGTVFDTIPTEFYLPFPFLSKFMYFKWRHYFVKPQEPLDFHSWEVPEKLNLLHKSIQDIYPMFKYAYYLWDHNVIWNLMNDIKYFRNIHLLTEEDSRMIKKDIHQMLYSLDGVAKKTVTDYLCAQHIEFYISSVSVGMTFSYHIAKNHSTCMFRTFFARSSTCTDREVCLKMRDWLYSMRKVSTLISESGEKERLLFFEEQHQLVDLI